MAVFCGVCNFVLATSDVSTVALAIEDPCPRCNQPTRHAFTAVRKRDGTTKRHYPLIMARLQEFISARIMVWKLMHGGVFRFENTPVSEEYAWTLGEGEETIQIEAEEAALDLQSAHAALV